MGYRNYIGKITKKNYDKVKDLKKEEIFKEDEVLEFDKDFVELIELGKYRDIIDEKFCKPFFSNKETQAEILIDQEYFIVGKEYILSLIKEFKDRVNYHLNKIKDAIKNKDISKIQNLLNSELSFKILDLEDIDNSTIIENKNLLIRDSWLYEYSMFQLIYIYKTFDWENDLLIYYGG